MQSIESLNIPNLLKNCKSPKEIEFHDFKLTKVRFESSKEILSKVECVMIDTCDNDGHFLDAVLGSCLNLKSLCMDGWFFFFKTDHCHWVNRQNPKLE